MYRACAITPQFENQFLNLPGTYLVFHLEFEANVRVRRRDRIT